MTEPVAYLNKYKDKSTNITIFKPIDNPAVVSSNKLYTADQLHQRVKMTQAEFDEWHKLVGEVADLYTAVTEICDISPYPSLYCRFFDLQNEDIDRTRKTQVEFATLWGIFDEFNPEETIEIVPNMKWFVRSKEKTQGFYMFLGNLNELRDPWIFTKKDNDTSFAHKFDTKEDAEKWKNPLTEVVRLPVEE